MQPWVAAKKGVLDSLAVTPAAVRVPNQWPLAPSATSVLSNVKIGVIMR